MSGRRCTVCTHSQRSEVDRALVKGAPKRRIATDYGLTESAVRRHAARHIPKLLTEAAEARAKEERLTAADLLSDLRNLQKTAQRLLTKAEKMGDLPTALRAVGELRGLLSVGLKGVEVAELEERLDAVEAALTDTPNRKRTA